MSAKPGKDEHPVMGRTRTRSSRHYRVRWLDEQVAEVLLLLPGWQAAELEARAISSHLTLGQLIRLLISEYLARQMEPRGEEERLKFGRPRGV